MATQGQGGVSVRFEQTGVEEMQKSIDGLNETIQQLAEYVAQLTGGEKELITTTQELNRVQNQVSVSSGLGNNALRRQLVSFSRLQGGIAAVVPELGSLSYGLRRVAIATGGLLTINPAFAALASAAAAVGLAINHLRENTLKAREEMEKLVEAQFQERLVASNIANNQPQVVFETQSHLNFGNIDTAELDKYIDRQDKEIEKDKSMIALRRESIKQATAEIAVYDRMTAASNRYKRAADWVALSDSPSEDALRELADACANFQETYSDIAKSLGKEIFDPADITKAGALLDDLGNSAKNARRSTKEFNKQLGELDTHLATLAQRRTAADALRDTATAFTEAKNAAKAELEAEREQARVEQEIATERNRFARLQSRVERRMIDNYAANFRSPDALKKEAQRLRDAIEGENDIQQIIFNEAKNRKWDSPKALTDQEQETIDKSEARRSLFEYALSQIENALGSTAPIDPFRNFSATQTDLESHGADIGAGVGGSSIDDRLQKMSTYLQQIAENTKVTEPATIAP